MKNLKVVICAFAVYPHVLSSEGIVNANWISVLTNKYQCLILSVYQSISKKRVVGETFINSNSNNFLKFISNYKRSKNTLVIISYRILNKAFLLVTRDHFQTFIWNRKQTKSLNLISNQEIKFIVWARVLPVFSLRPILNSYQKRPFPLIINVNDPFEFDNYNTTSPTTFTKLINYTQCWTFPSWSLAQRTIKNYKLDAKRCFVIPHAMEKQEVLYEGKTNFPDRKLKFIYTGTFYKSAFTDNLKNALIEFSNRNYSFEKEFIFILSQYDKESIQWLKKSIQDVKILTKLRREEVLIELSRADCVLAIDADSHKELLKGKLMEAISFGLPILGITYKDSVMEKVVLEYGGFCSYQNSHNDILDTFENACNCLKSEDWHNTFYIKRKTVMNKVSSDKILEISDQIINFAYKRFNNISGSTIAPPLLPMWP